MAFTPVRQVSIHGRRVGLTSTGALYLQDAAGNIQAAVVESTAGVINANIPATVSSTVASTLTNHGITLLSSASATAITMEITAPVAGVTKTIIIDTSSSELSLGGTATSILFQSTVAGAAGSTLFYAAAAPLAGKSAIVLKGVSATQYAVAGSTANITVG